jgi:hypothetical protein
LVGLAAWDLTSCGERPGQEHRTVLTHGRTRHTTVGLPAIRLHDVRHSYATAALAAGIPGLDEQAAAAVARLILGGSDTASMG